MDKKTWDRLKDPKTNKCMVCGKDKKHCYCDEYVYRYPDNPKRPDSFEQTDWQEIISAKENNE